MRATDAAGNLSAYSNVASATTAAAARHDAADGADGAGGDGDASSSINLSWTASTDNVAVTGYRVERCQGAGCSNFAQVGTPTATTFADTGLLAGTSYSYRVRATDAAGNLSAYSNMASATTAAAARHDAADGADGAGGDGHGSTGINLSWTASTDNVAVTGYRVERCQGAGCSNFAQVGTPTATTFNDTGLLAGTSYSYRVRATDAAGNLSAYSNVASATTAAAGSALVAAYAFDEGAARRSPTCPGTGITGRLRVRHGPTAGKYGNALVFNGTQRRGHDQRLGIAPLTTAMTLEAWVNPSTGSSAWRDVIYKGNDNYYLEGSSSTAESSAAGGTLPPALADPLWTAALPTNVGRTLRPAYDGAALRLYLNGTLCFEPGDGQARSRRRPIRCRSAATASTGQFFREQSTRFESTTALWRRQRSRRT